MNWIKITKDPKTWPEIKQKVLISYLKDFEYPWGIERIFEIGYRMKGGQDDNYPMITCVVIREDTVVHWQEITFDEKEA